VIIPNDGYVLASDIGIDSRALICNTNRSDCCRASDTADGVAQGNWYYPDGSEIPSFTIQSAANPTRNYFFRDRFIGIVRLNRQGIPPERNRGRFHCEIPSANGVTVIQYVNIGEYVSTIPINKETM
jgi:hypothetical protein